MIWALYHYGISHKAPIRRGRWVAHVRYLARRSRIRRTAWTNGTMVASCAATSVLATRQSGIHDSPEANTNLHDPVISFTSSESVTAPGATKRSVDVDEGGSVDGSSLIR